MVIGGTSQLKKIQVSMAQGVLKQKGWQGFRMRDQVGKVMKKIGQRNR